MVVTLIQPKQVKGTVQAWAPRGPANPNQSQFNAHQCSPYYIVSHPLPTVHELIPVHERKRRWSIATSATFPAFDEHCERPAQRSKSSISLWSVEADVSKQRPLPSQFNGAPRQYGQNGQDPPRQQAVYLADAYQGDAFGPDDHHWDEQSMAAYNANPLQWDGFWQDGNNSHGILARNTSAKSIPNKPSVSASPRSLPLMGLRKRLYYNYIAVETNPLPPQGESEIIAHVHAPKIDTVGPNRHSCMRCSRIF